MELALFVYCIDLFSKLSTISLFLFFFFVIAGNIISILWMGTQPDGTKYPKWHNVIAAIFLLIALVTPKEKTMYLMAGAYAAQSIYQSEAGTKVQKIISNKLDVYIKEQEAALMGENNGSTAKK